MIRLLPILLLALALSGCASRNFPDFPDFYTGNNANCVNQMKPGGQVPPECWNG